MLGEGGLDEDMKEMLKEELSEAKSAKEELEEKIKILLLPKDPNDDKNIILEIRGAAGGDEAALFAGDLLNMYQHYAESQGWKFEIMEASVTSIGGYKEVSALVSGTSVYSKLKYESGAHRVQRVPSTETQGRVHTSTATVLVMPEVEEFEMKIGKISVLISTTPQVLVDKMSIRLRQLYVWFTCLQVSKSKCKKNVRSKKTVTRLSSCLTQRYLITINKLSWINKTPNASLLSEQVTVQNVSVPIISHKTV